MPNANGDELMGVFEIYKDTILAIASRKFDKGDLRPRITDKDIKIGLLKVPNSPMRSAN